MLWQLFPCSPSLAAAMRKSMSLVFLTRTDAMASSSRLRQLPGTMS